ncbi:hypothetical protein EN943_31380 [Mesorhizobium sp. M7A.F.Ca.US.006.01.1.1]|nr:hypothetical protein EN943_31380 [Mesorhizobium sp. M7A.F.Ca.US.006.01.1.1]
MAAIGSCPSSTPSIGGEVARRSRDGVGVDLARACIHARSAIPSRAQINRRTPRPRCACRA